MPDNDTQGRSALHCEFFQYLPEVVETYHVAKVLRCSRSTAQRRMDKRYGGVLIGGTYYLFKADFIAREPIARDLYARLFPGAPLPEPLKTFKDILVLREIASLFRWGDQRARHYMKEVLGAFKDGARLKLYKVDLIAFMRQNQPDRQN